MSDINQTALRAPQSSEQANDSYVGVIAWLAAQGFSGGFVSATAIALFWVMSHVALPGDPPYTEMSLTIDKLAPFAMFAALLRGLSISIRRVVTGRRAEP